MGKLTDLKRPRGGGLYHKLGLVSRSLYIARSGRQFFRQLRDEYLKGKKKPINPSVAKVRKKIAARTPLYSNPKLYGRGISMAANKRRAALAKQLRGQARPTRTHTGPKIAGKAPILRTHNPADTSVASAVKMSKTQGQLKRRLTARAVRSVTSSLRQGTTRKQTADFIRAQKKKDPKTMRHIVKLKKHELIGQAKPYLRKGP